MIICIASDLALMANVWIAVTFPKIYLAPAHLLTRSCRDAARPYIRGSRYLNASEADHRTAKVIAEVGRAIK